MRLLLPWCLLHSSLAFHLTKRFKSTDLKPPARRLNVKQSLVQNTPKDDIDLQDLRHERIQISSVANDGFGVTRRTALIAASLSMCTPTEMANGKSYSENQSNPSPTVSLRTKDAFGKTVTMPLIAYSFYKTPPEQAPRAMALALRAGVRHFDLATDYANFNDIAPLLAMYLGTGKIEWDFEHEKDELLQILDDTEKAADFSMKKKSLGRKQRRQDMFVTYKLSNSEQSTDPSSTRNIIRRLLSELGTPYLDLVCLHSPLPGSELRIATYRTLIQLQEEGLIRSVGVCNYGLCHLKEISYHNLPMPTVNQLEISPFNKHEPIVQYCNDNDIQISCAAWSKLSGVSGPQQQWAQLSELARNKNVTKAQILVRWALQKRYACAPRYVSHIICLCTHDSSLD